MFGGLPNGVSDGVGLRRREVGRGQRSGDGVGVQHRSFPTAPRYHGRLRPAPGSGRIPRHDLHMEQKMALDGSRYLTAFPRGDDGQNRAFVVELTRQFRF